MIDNFSTAPYNIRSSLLSANISPITSPIADSRWVNGGGTQAWSSFVDTEAGTLNYSISGSPSPGQRLEISYSRDSASLDFAGFSHFEVSVQDLAGTADLYVFYRGSSDPVLPRVPFTIDSSEDYLIPLSLIGEDDPFLPSLVDFRVFPTSDDFSITLSSIGVIPEPSYEVMMVFIGAATIILRRRRKS